MPVSAFYIYIYVDTQQCCRHHAEGCVTHRARVETLLTALAGDALKQCYGAIVWCFLWQMVPIHDSVGEEAEFVRIQ